MTSVPTSPVARPLWINDAGFAAPAVGAADPSYTYFNVGLAFTTRRSARPALPRHGSEPPRLQKLPGRVGAQSRERLV